MKRVLILTLEQGKNYGGILQAYALQSFIESLDCKAKTAAYIHSQSLLGSALKLLVKSVLHVINPRVSNLSQAEHTAITTRTRNFISKSMKIISLNTAKHNLNDNFDVLIVGSDQVWRSAYTSVERYMFDFAEKVDGITRISYAASFGRDDLSEYSPALLKKSARLAKKFDAISVREDSGVDLVKEHWDMNAEQHVDPTLLLEKEHYIQLIKEDSDNVLPSKGSLFAYVLDRAGDKGAVIDKIANALKLQDFEIMPPKATSRKLFQANPEKYQLPPVTQWLKSFADAEFIVTDSFHGTAFSIIFNKPFIAIGNKERGLARFSSLLKLFNLEHRLVSSVDEITSELINEKIDWKHVNKKVKSEQKRSMEYLRKHLV